jgi:hypothetical protein
MPKLQRAITGLSIAAAFRWVRGSDSGAYSPIILTSTLFL